MKQRLPMSNKPLLIGIPATLLLGMLVYQQIQINSLKTEAKQSAIRTTNIGESAGLQFRLNKAYEDKARGLPHENIPYLIEQISKRK